MAVSLLDKSDHPCARDSEVSVSYPLMISDALTIKYPLHGYPKT